MERSYQNICVALSYKEGTGAARAAVAEFAVLLGQHRYNLVYGGGFEGLMGVLMSRYQDNLERVPTDFASSYDDSNPVVCVKAISTEFYACGMPGRMNQRLLGSQNKIIVRNLHERKQKMIEHSDVLVAFPGGIQTADEVIAFATENGYGKHLDQDGVIKPIICVEPDGDNYEWLKVKLKHDINEGYTSAQTRSMFIFVSSGLEVIQTLNNFNSRSPRPLSDLLPLA